MKLKLAILAILPVVGRIEAEERFLSTQFGAAYGAYRGRTRRLVPWLC